MVYFIDRLDELALSERLRQYENTRGMRVSAEIDDRGDTRRGSSLR